MGYDGAMKSSPSKVFPAALLAAAALVLPMSPVSAPAHAQAGGKPLPSIARVGSELNMFIELHNHLLFASRADEDALPEYRSAVKAYRDAKELAKDPAVMQTVTDACIAGPDITAIGSTVTRLPATMSPADQEAVRKMIGAIVSAWPRFERTEGPEHRRSLQTIWSRVMLKHWGLVQDRLLTKLYEKFAFLPLDKSITLYPVLETTELGVSGSTAQGYYAVIPVMKAPNLMIIEEMLHEVTHVIDQYQPPASQSVLIRIRRRAGHVDPQALNSFMHGLITWNAGELVRRLVSADYKPLIDVSSPMREPLAPYLANYEGPWAGYLEDKLTADQAIDGMLAGLKPAPPPAASPAAPGS